MEHLDHLFEYADELRQLGRPEEALAGLGDLLDGDLGGVETLFRRAFLLRDLGRFQEAKRDFERAADAEPWSGWPLLRLAQMFQALDRPWLAAACVEQALERQPGTVEICAHASEIFASLGWLDKAFQVVRPVPPELEGWFGHMRRQAEAEYRHHHSLTLAMLQQLSRPRPSGPLMRDVVTALFKVGRIREARAVCMVLMRDQPDRFDNFELYGRIVAREGGLMEAVSFLRGIMFLHRENPEYCRALTFMESQLSL